MYENTSVMISFMQYPLNIVFTTLDPSDTVIIVFLKRVWGCLTFVSSSLLSEGGVVWNMITKAIRPLLEAQVLAIRHNTDKADNKFS